MRVTYQNGEFRAITDFSEKDLIKGKGWQWAMYRTDGGEKGRFWYTDEPARAKVFIQFADETCRAELAPSGTVGPPPAEIPGPQWATDREYQLKWIAEHARAVPLSDPMDAIREALAQMWMASLDVMPEHSEVGELEKWLEL